MANWGLPLAALSDLRKDESLISATMTPTLCAYSCVFMLFAWRVKPRNMLLFACHAVNATAQGVQCARLINYKLAHRDGAPAAQAPAAEAPAAEAAPAK